MSKKKLLNSITGKASFSNPLDNAIGWGKGYAKKSAQDLYESLHTKTTASFHVELDPKGVQELFKSKEMQDYLQSVADAVAAEASTMSGEKYDGNIKVLDNTAIAYVQPHGEAARKDAYENNTPLKAANVLNLPQGKPEGPGLRKNLEDLLNKGK